MIGKTIITSILWKCHWNYEEHIKTFEKKRSNTMWNPWTFHNLAFELLVWRLNIPLERLHVWCHFYIPNFVFCDFLHNEHMLIFYSHLVNLNNSKYIHTSSVINFEIVEVDQERIKPLKVWCILHSKKWSKIVNLNLTHQQRSSSNH